MAKTLAQYKDALAGLVTNLTTDVGSGLDMGNNPKARQLVEEYVAYAKGKNGAEDTQTFACWIEGEGKDNATQAGDQLEAAITYMQRQETTDDVLKDVYIDGRLVVEKSGNWLGDNWPLLAAVAAPLLLGNFFEIGTISTILVGVLGLGAAAVFSNENSLLAPVGQFIRDNTNNLFGLLPPQKGAGQAKDVVSSDAVSPPTPATVQVVEVDVGKKSALDNADKMAETTIKIGAEEQKINLLGTTTEGVTTFDRYVLVDGDKISAPLTLPRGAVPTLEMADGKPVLKLTEEVTGGIQALQNDNAFNAARAALKEIPAPASKSAEAEAPKTEVSPAKKPAVANTETLTLRIVNDVAIFGVDVRSDTITASGQSQLPRTVSMIVELPADRLEGKVTKYFITDEEGKETGVSLTLSPSETVTFTEEGKPMRGGKPFTPSEAHINDLQRLAQAQYDYDNSPVPPAPQSPVPPSIDPDKLRPLVDAVGMVVAPVSYRVATVASALFRGAAAQSDFVSGNVTLTQGTAAANTPSDQSVDTGNGVDVTLKAASNTDPNVARTFKGKAMSDGSLVVTDVLMSGEAGKSAEFRALTHAVAFKDVMDNSAGCSVSGTPPVINFDRLKVASGQHSVATEDFLGFSPISLLTERRFSEWLGDFGPSLNAARAEKEGIVAPLAGTKTASQQKSAGK